MCTGVYLEKFVKQANGQFLYWSSGFVVTYSVCPIAWQSTKLWAWSNYLAQSVLWDIMIVCNLQLVENKY